MEASTWPLVGEIRWSAPWAGSVTQSDPNGHHRSGDRRYPELDDGSMLAATPRRPYPGEAASGRRAGWFRVATDTVADAATPDTRRKGIGCCPPQGWIGLGRSGRRGGRGRGRRRNARALGAASGRDDRAPRRRATQHRRPGRARVPRALGGSARRCRSRDMAASDPHSARPGSGTHRRLGTCAEGRALYLRPTRASRPDLRSCRSRPAGVWWTMCGHRPTIRPRAGVQRRTT